MLLRGVQNGKAVESKRIVSCVKRALNPYSEWDAMLATAQDASRLRFVVSNTTEAGIAYAEEAYTPGQCQVSFPAKVTALLLARFKLSAQRADGTRLPAVRTDRSQRHETQEVRAAIRASVVAAGRLHCLGREAQRLLQHAGRPHRPATRRPKRPRSASSSAMKTCCWSPPNRSCCGSSKARRRSPKNCRCTRPDSTRCGSRRPANRTLRARCASSTVRTPRARWRRTAPASTASSR